MAKSILELSGYINLVCSMAIEDNGKFLMVQEAKPSVKGLWNFPSGKAEEGETLLEAAQREILEETGQVADITGLCSIYHYAWDDKNGITLRFNFYGKIRHQVSNPKLASDITIAEWKTLGEMEELKQSGQLRFAGVARMIDDVAAGHRASLDILFTSSSSLK